MLFVFFFKQKTAYEMRISDWSSDVCSSDLRPASAMVLALRSVLEVAHGWENQAVARGVVDLLARTDFPSRDWTIGHVIDELVRSGPGVPYWHAQRMLPILLGLVDSGGDTLTHAQVISSEERSVGKECGSTCSSRWSP